jgi:hypothetical protein
MPRSLLIILASVVLFVIVAGAGISVVVYRVDTLDAQSKAFIDSAVPAITAKWDIAQLLDRGTPDMRDRTGPDDGKALAGMPANLGQFSEYLGATGKVNLLSLTGLTGSVSASYVAKASFQKGVVTFDFELVRRDGRWMIDQYHIGALVLGSPNRDLLQSQPDIRG